MNIEDICKTGPTVYSPRLRRLESVALQRQHFFLSYFKIPSVGPSGGGGGGYKCNTNKE